MSLKIIPQNEFDKIRNSNIAKVNMFELFALMCRFNTLLAVKNAGSGHLGSSFSAMDIVVYLYLNEINILSEGLTSLNRDIYFSSKGHDVPGLYSVLFGLGIIEQDKFLKLRKLGGLDGHPDVRIKGIESNTGSLGMGISKGKGISWAKNYLNVAGNVFVLTGDGEFQEGQIFESLQATAHQKINNLIVIIDKNKYQTDKLVTDINSIEDIEKKVSDFNWHTFKIDGHNFSEIESTIRNAKLLLDKPKLIIADTIKGKGVSFMEKSEEVLFDGKPLYKWHSGAPDDASFSFACDELIKKINTKTKLLNISHIEFSNIEETPKLITQKLNEYVSDAFGEALCRLSKCRKNIIVLDGDLSSDCKLRNFEKLFPERFIENGIAEQDMVSMAGGLARMGLLPIVNTFSSFLSARANEQIYNNACEKTKIIYVAHFSGFIPAGPGKSHQSVRDIALFGSIPNMIIVQPCNKLETESLLQYCIDTSKENCMLRLNIGPSPSIIELPADYKLEYGKGVVLNQGNDAILFAYGPVMLNEALKASKILKNVQFHLKVVNLPWLNRFDSYWLEEILRNQIHIFILDDHLTFGGLGDFLISKLNDNKLIKNKDIYKLGLNELPECGTPSEVLEFHKLDGKSIAITILNKIKGLIIESIEEPSLDGEFSNESPQ